MDFILSLFSGLGTLTPIVGIVLLVFFLRQSKAQEFDIPPLDLLDAKKLDEMVSTQAQAVIRPMLQSKGYTEEQMKQILTRTSVGGNAFRR
jgi:hypothetical protein